jgi:predicted XRE-type DNA-binding protein
MIKQPILTDHEHLAILVHRLCVIHEMKRKEVCAHLGITKSHLSNLVNYKVGGVRRAYIQALTALCEQKEAVKKGEAK